MSFFWLQTLLFSVCSFAASQKMPSCVLDFQRLQNCDTIYHNLQMYILTVCVGQLLLLHIVAAVQICFFKFKNNARACGLF